MVERQLKTPRQMERHLKGISNHYRIAILLLLEKRKQLVFGQIVDLLGANDKTIGEHTRRLVQSGLVNKHYQGNNVLHTLSPYGKTIARFLKSFQEIQ